MAADRAGPPRVFFVSYADAELVIAGYSTESSYTSAIAACPFESGRSALRRMPAAGCHGSLVGSRQSMTIWLRENGMRQGSRRTGFLASPQDAEDANPFGLLVNAEREDSVVAEEGLTVR